tara:strand:- start:678 stop:908 length:231 start_codon:yes stop_codon:yes gene_type:complete
MAKIKTVFLGTESSGTGQHELRCFANTRNEIYISIEELDFPYSSISLDVSTAIKLSKTLRTAINIIKTEEKEVIND